MTTRVRVALLGTSWWVDAMYVPALIDHPRAEVVAVCGRRPEPADELADRWGIEGRFTDPDQMFESARPDAVVIATTNDSHHDLAVNALDRGIHVLCEKPMALNAGQAEAMAAAAERAGATTMVPYTYRYMPHNRWVRRLVADGFVGKPLHINARYYTDFGFDDRYSWRFDREIAGSGLLGDLGPHWIDLARWLLDDTEVTVSSHAATFTDRADRPDGSDYDRTEDSAVITVGYRSGAYGVLHISAVCVEGSSFGQSHHLEIHGDQGTIHATCDWDTIQEVRGLKRGETGPLRPLPIPDDIWGPVRRDQVHDTYRDVFRTTEAMTREWITAVADGRPVSPDFDQGLAVQRVLDGAVASAATGGCAVTVASAR